MTDESTTESPEVEILTHRIAIPNVEFLDVVDACAQLGLNSGRISKNVTFYEGEPIQTIDIVFETDADSIYPFLYAFGEQFPKTKVMIADGEMWENTRAMVTSS